MGRSDEKGGLKPFVLFLDENHCGNRHLLAVLLETGVSFVRHLDYFAAGTEDVVWLPEIGRRGWSLLTTDKRIRKRPLERDAVKVNQIRMFYFANNDASGEQMALTLKAALPSMQRIATDQSPPFTASISKSGLVQLRNI